MCNAWNHSSYCTCGWGGAGHLGRPARNVHANHAMWPSGIPPINGSISSVTIPNARCPVCGELVFYYCNEYGSSVFFDELGPPWPKHPCTNRAAIAQPLVPSVGAITSYSRVPHWSRESWHLTVVGHVASIDNHVCEVSVRDKTSGADQLMYATTRQARGTIDIIGAFPKHALVFMRQVRSGVFSLTTLNRTLRPVQLDAFSSLISLREQMRSVTPFQHSKKRRKSPKTTALLSGNGSSAKENTAMSEAFAKAKQHNSSFKRTR